LWPVEAAVEPLDPSGGVDDALLAREERVAHVANVHVHVALGGARLDNVATAAANRRRLVLGMNPGFHFFS
jgi:hypothetical protein